MEKFYILAKRLADAFDQSGVDYAFTGALAVSFYGTPRTTSDVDLMVAVSSKTEVKRKVAEALRKAGLNVEECRIDDALTSGYNIATFRDKTSAYKVDVIFQAGTLEKQPATVAGVETFLQKPEGLVLAKLRMIKATVLRERAVKDEDDVKAILAFTKVDLAAVKRQAKKEGTLEIFQALKDNE